MKILVIPDMQVKPGVDLAYVERIGSYIVEKQPDVIVNLGDMADMESLSSYDVGKILNVQLMLKSNCSLH
jgi:hypothetical protein